MLQAYKDLLQSFKQYQISSIIEGISTKIFATLESAQFNPQIRHYFTNIAKSGQPFNDYDLDPDNVSQIKKLLNALYYARMTFLDLEKANFNATDLISLYSKTINDAYEASFLITHLDVDIKEMFQEEFNRLTEKVAEIKEKQPELTFQKCDEKFERYPLSYKIGEVTGITITQMQPNSGDLDYNFLTQFSAVLPQYIDKVTQFVQQYSSELTAQEPTLNNVRLQELQAAALKLLNDLESLKSGRNFLTSLKFLNYIHIIRNIITLAKSALEQISHLSESTQEVIKDHLAQLKYSALPELFGLVDKIEVNCMLKPGTLSIELMEKIKPLYQALIDLAKKPVNFNEKGQELLSIEDSRFLDLRLEKTYDRINKANKELNRIHKAETACTAFFELLDKYEKIPLTKLPLNEKAKLAEHYKLVRPYMAQIDPDLNKHIINALLDKNVDGMLNILWQYLSKSLESDNIEHLKAQRTRVSRLIMKKLNTQEFHILLNTKLIESVHQTTNLDLFPYSDTSTIITAEELETIETFNFSTELEAQLYSSDEYAVLATAGESNHAAQFALNAKDNLIINPEVLTADQTLILFQWYTRKVKQFNEANTFLEQFNALLKTSIKEQYPIPPHAVHFDQLKEENREQFRILYKKLKPYFITVLPDEMKIFATKLDNYLEPKNSSKAMDPPLLVTCEKLAIFLKTVFKEKNTIWKKQSQFYFKQAKHKFASNEQDVFLIDEARILRLNNEHKLEVKFTKEPRKKLVADPHTLNAQQALTLAQWYKHKRKKFALAARAYEQFCTLLRKITQDTNPQAENRLNLNQLSKNQKVEFKKLYHLFQPFFIHGVESEYKEQVLAFDKYLVLCFADKGSLVEIPTVDMFEQLDEHIQSYFTDVDLSWGRRSSLYDKLASEKYYQEHQAQPLAHELFADRASYVLKHTNYSKFVFEFRKSLQHLTSLFNQSMQRELTIQQPSDLPFPELKDVYKTKMQSAQVLAIKEIYNALYHIEKTIVQIEKLNDKSSKLMYISELLTAYQHVNEIIKLTLKLKNDPHIQFLSDEILDKAQTMWAIIQENISAYEESAANVHPVFAPVKYNGLWYTLNAFNIIPRHIRSLTNATYLTQQEINGLHVSAKQTTIDIEKLINSSHSYFKLFLQTPTMLRLYNDLSKRVTEFISTLHHTATYNLGHFHEAIFTPMLLEADRWEDQLGLIPGTLSEPLHTILDQYYKGLLHPLKLHSKTHIDFVCAKSPIKKRTEQILEVRNRTKAEIDELDTLYEQVIVLNKLVQLHDDLTQAYIAPSAITLSQLMTTMKEIYKNALPALVTAREELDFKASEKYDSQFDTELNQSLNEYDPKLSDVKNLIKLGYAHFMGQRNTKQMTLATAEEKYLYLQQASLAQDESNEQFILNYTIEAFEKCCNELAGRHVGLQYVDEEYNTNLKNYLFNFKEGIINNAQSQNDINLRVRELLKTKIRDFEHDYFSKYYHLDTIQVALAQFKNYFSHSTLQITQSGSFIESEETLAKKSHLINQLVQIANDKTLDVDKRIVKIKYKVINDPSFSRIILEQKTISPGFSYLAQLFLSLLEALHLYTPQRSARLHLLEKAVTTEPKIAELTDRFGLFTTAKNKMKETLHKPNDSIDDAPLSPPMSSNESAP